MAALQTVPQRFCQQSIVVYSSGSRPQGLSDPSSPNGSLSVRGTTRWTARGALLAGVLALPKEDEALRAVLERCQQGAHGGKEGLLLSGGVQGSGHLPPPPPGS